MFQLLLLYALMLQCCAVTPSPNLVFIVADDLGWNDVGYHNPDIVSPNIDHLARTGIELNHSYVQPLCSPSRTTFMTGIYPFRLGLQHMVIAPRKQVCVPLNTTFFPEVLKQHGYKTHMIGKWHLGFCQWACTPTYRGFDSFYGFYNGGEHYYMKIFPYGYDFRFNTTVDLTANGNYSTEQFASRAEDIIRYHDTDNPLYIYMPFQSVHMPLAVPDHYLDLYSHINDTTRKLLSAMVTSMDDAIGRVVTALKQKGIYNNTLILFSSDNGGWTPYGGNNYPLRGGKVSLFEGGTRVPAFLHSPLLSKSGSVYDGVIHAVDWFPTLANALGIKYNDPNQDGVNQWDAITSLGQSKRSEFVYNMDYHPLPIQGAAAIRVGDYKLIEGFPGVYSDWYKPEAPDQGINFTMEMTVSLDWAAQVPGITNATASYLFNLIDDPTEQNNLYDQLPEVAKELHDKLAEHKSRYVPPSWPADSPLADPDNFGGLWAPGWC